jgi:general secretion pathway protein G
MPRPARALSLRPVHPLGPGPSYPSPRPHSVAARAEARRTLSFNVLLATPLAMMLTYVLGPLPLLVSIGVIAVLFVRDLLALGSALRATFRRLRGLPPVREGIDYGVGRNVWRRTTAAGSPYRAQDRVELLALGAPYDAAALLARNLVVHAGCALLPAFMLVGVPTKPATCHACAGACRTAANTIRSATILYRSASPPAPCPTVAQLKERGLLDRSFSAKDHWGNAFEVTCDGDEVTVRTNGPDHKRGTQDDVVVPPP